MQPINLDQLPLQSSGETNQNDISLEMAGPPQLGDLLPLVAAFHLFEEISLAADIREKSVERLLNDGTLGQVWLIKRTNRLIGYVVACFSYSVKLGGREVVIDELYIKAPERGAGVGAEVLGQLKEHMRSNNVVAIQLVVNQRNERAKTLYLQSGFSCRDKYQVMIIALK